MDGASYDSNIYFHVDIISFLLLMASPLASTHFFPFGIPINFHSVMQLHDCTKFTNIKDIHLTTFLWI